MGEVTGGVAVAEGATAEAARVVARAEDWGREMWAGAVKAEETAAVAAVEKAAVAAASAREVVRAARAASAAARGMRVK